VYLTSSCSLAIKLRRSDGTEVWRSQADCGGGGGEVGVLYRDRLYTRAFPHLPSGMDWTLNAKTGKRVAANPGGADPAFADPTKFVGPVYDEPTAHALAAEHGWVVKPDGKHWRRVVPSPRPVRIFEIRPVDLLLREGCVVICAGGGGIPTMFQRDAQGQPVNVLAGVEAVVDKDLASGVLARELGADAFIMATDVPAVIHDWGMPSAREIAAASPQWLLAQGYPAGSMGPKVEAAAAFATATGRPACIGPLDAIGEMLDGRAGTHVSTHLAEPIRFR
jgi:carbamate kinase